MSALADYRHIWRHAAGPCALRRVVAAICIVSAGAGTWLAYHDAGQAIGPAPVALVVLPVVLLALLYWLELVSGAVKQLTPANAQLVPRLRPRSLQLVGVCFAVFTLLTTFILGGIFGNKALWLAVTSAWLVGAAMTRVGLQHGIVLQFFPFMMMMLPRSVLQSIRELGATPAGIALCCLVALAVAWYGMRALFPTGEGRIRQRAAVEKGLRAAQDPAARGNEQPGASVRGWYARALALAGRNRKAAGERMLHALGPAAHWSQSASVLAVLMLVLVAGRLLIGMASSDNQQALSVVGGFVVFPLLMLFAVAPQRIAARAAVTAGEQSLLRLTPAAPQARVFNRKVADALIRRVLIEWALVTAGLLGATAMVNAPWTIVLLQLGVCCLALPLTTVVLRDYARSPKLTGYYNYLALLGLMVSAGATYFASSRGWPVPAAVVAIIAGVGVTAVMAASRKRRMLASPVAFPAGRLAA